jgi:hypothetical protein
MHAISSIAKNALLNLADRDLADAIGSAFDHEALVIKRIESVFERLAERAWSPPTLMKFFAGWRDTHLTSSSVAALVCRLLAQNEQSPAFICAAQSAANIIHEDLGLTGETHHRLFERLANRMCSSDQWKLDAFAVKSARGFSQWVHHQRVSAPIDEALITTIASEIYNHGEYTYASPLFRKWIQEQHLVPSEQIQSTLAYILVHTGATESDHFLHCVEALEKYLEGCGGQLDLTQVTSTCRRYFYKLGLAFAGIEAVLDEEQPKETGWIGTVALVTI